MTRPPLPSIVSSWKKRDKLITAWLLSLPGQALTTFASSRPPAPPGMNRRLLPWRATAASFCCKAGRGFSCTLGCPDLHNIQPCKLIFGNVMYGYHMDQNPPKNYL